MIIYILIIWYACLCCAWAPPWTQEFGYQGDRSAPCRNLNIPRHPGWHFFSNSYMKLLNDDNRPWRNPLNHAFLRFPGFPDDVVLPDPLLPTDDIGALEIYQQAIMALMENEHTSKHDKNHADDMYASDLLCWERIEGCQIVTWLGSSPMWSCISDPAATVEESKHFKDLELDDMTLSLLQRSYRYALVNLGRKLVPFIQHVREGPGHSKRQYQSFRDGGIIIPTFAKYSQAVMDHFMDPVHQQECADVRRPHLRNHIMPPEPLLSTVDNIFLDTDKTMVTLYRDALVAHDMATLMSASDRNRKHQRFEADSWEWIIHDACFYNREACNLEDSSARWNDHNWFLGHLETAKRLKKDMEEQGLVELGGLLLNEVKRSHGTRVELELLLSNWVRD